MLEQMREAGFAALLVTRTDVIPEIDTDNRDAVVFVNEQSQTVRQHEFTMLNRVTAAVKRGGFILRRDGQQIDLKDD